MKCLANALVTALQCGRALGSMQQYCLGILKHHTALERKLCVNRWIIDPKVNFLPS